MAGIFPNETGVYFVNSGTAGSAVTEGSRVIGEITNLALSGGEFGKETVPVIGGFVEKEVPRTAFELSFDIIVQNTDVSTMDRFDRLKFGGLGTSNLEPSIISIYICSSTGSGYKTFAMNNARLTQWEPTLAADDMLRGTAKFTADPTTPLGVANVRTSALNKSDGYFTWS